MGHLSEAAVAKFCSDTDLWLGNCRHGNREGGGLESPSPAVPTSEVVSEFKASLETVSLWSLTSEAEAPAAAAVVSRGLGTLR